jgi:hypothetical protein
MVGPGGVLMAVWSAMVARYGPKALVRMGSDKPMEY